MGDDAAVFVAESTTTFPARGDRGPKEYVNWNTLVWTRVGGTWKLAHWQSQKGGIEAERELWNAVLSRSVGSEYRSKPATRDTVKGRKPGTALDLLMGQGRNAVYLASQGWKVTGVDISDEGIRIARENAAKQKLALETVNADAERWDFGTDRWDLITMIFAGFDAKTAKRAKAALRKGGLIVIESYHRDRNSSFAPGIATGEIAPHFKDGFKVLRDEVVEDIADWGQHESKLVRFVAQKL